MRYKPIPKPPIRDPAVMARMEVAIDLFESARRMMRSTIRRRHPEASEEEVDAMLRDWMHRRPGAEHGDAEGYPSSRFT